MIRTTHFSSKALAWLFVPALAGSLLLSSCNSEPTATEADKTATVVPSDMNEASDSSATTATDTMATDAGTR
ncbi:hypothetical protein [Hymenobacter sp. B1770]|uniref:hypothetical protein n=1 Tax=Hymenobacter sp. B1770 TaxID=1718788 RepID=UPI003CE8D424